MNLTQTCLLKALGCAVLFFLVLQGYLLWRGPGIHPIDYARSKSRAYNMVQDFVKLTNSKGVQAILVDPYILNELVNENWEDGQRICRFLCKNHIYTFAIIGSQFEEFKLTVLPRMNQQGFEVNATYPPGADKEFDTPTHVSLRDHENHAIHIVVFHDRYPKTRWHYWWYGPDLDDEHQLDFTQQEGAFDIFPHPAVTLDGVLVHLPLHPKLFLDEYKHSKFIPCNTTRATEFYKLYPRDNTEKANRFRTTASKAIQQAKSRLDDFGVPFWLSSGTLLGWFRQCDFIPYSVDVDLGIFIKDHQSDLVDKMRRSSMHLEHKFGRVSDSLQYAYDMGDVKLDLFFFYEERDHMWNGGTDVQSGAKYKYTFPKFTMCWTEFSGMKVRIPCNTETYIKANYGQNWFTPVKNWQWDKSPYNVEEVESWKDDELDEVIQMWDKKGHRIPLEWEHDKQEL